MAREPLARVECDPSELATMVEYAALRSGDPEAHDVMFVRLFGDRIATPATTPDADVKAYCTARAGMYEDLSLFVDQPVDALFDIDRVLGWLGWHGDSPLTVTFEGDPETGVTERLVHETADAEVVVPCDTDWTDDEVSLSLPARFRGDRLLDSTGDPVATRVDTDAATLHRLVDAADLVGSDEEYDVAVVDGALRLDAAGEDGTRIATTLSEATTGPDASVTVGPGFRRVVSSLVGPVELQIGPGSPLAIVRTHDAFTLRFVVAPA